MVEQQISMEILSSDSKSVFLIHKQKIFSDGQDEVLHVLDDASAKTLLRVLRWKIEEIHKRLILKHHRRIGINNL